LNFKKKLQIIPFSGTVLHNPRIHTKRVGEPEVQFTSGISDYHYMDLTFPGFANVTNVKINGRLCCVTLQENAVTQELSCEMVDGDDNEC
jgi:hypothetical protein